MAAYTVFVDETGTFDFRASAGASSVGGWVMEKECIPELARAIQESLKAYCSAHPGIPVSLPADLHLIPLLRPERRKDWERHLPSPELGRELVDSVLQRVRPLVVKAFHSQGRPTLFANEQACYLAVLQHTLVQLLNEPPLIGADVTLVIATRRHLELYGFAGNLYPMAYEEHLAKSLREFLLKTGTCQSLEISFEKADKSNGLAMADCILGLMKYRNLGISLGIDEDRKKVYGFQAGYRLTGLDPEVLKNLLEQSDSHFWLLELAEQCAGMPDNKSSLKALQKGYRKLPPELQGRFVEHVRDCLGWNLSQAPDRYDCLDGMEALLTVLGSLPPESEEKETETLTVHARLRQVLALARVRLDNHRGVGDPKRIESALHDLAREAPFSFPNRLEALQHRVELMLEGVHVSCMNLLDFEPVEKLLSPLFQDYRGVMRSMGDWGRGADANMARLAGTLGQCEAFRAELEEDPDRFEMADEYFHEDRAACLPDTPFWEQASGYLTLTALRRRNLALARARLAEEMARRAPAAVPPDLDDLSGLEEGYRPFVLAHHLQTLALAAREGGRVTGLERAWQILAADPALGDYPRFQCAKWLAVLLADQGEVEKARALLAKAVTPVPLETPILRLARLPLALLEYHLRKRMEERAMPSWENELEQLRRDLPKAARLLEKTPFERWGANPAGWDGFEVASLPPFYLS